MKATSKSPQDNDRRQRDQTFLRLGLTITNGKRVVILAIICMTVRLTTVSGRALVPEMDEAF